MAERNQCPKCGVALPYRALSCQCGWGKQQRRLDDGNSYACSYESNGMRCRYPGAIGFGGLGGGPLYCSTHIRERGTRFAQQAMEQSQSWRAPDAEHDHDVKMQAWLDQHFPLRSGESGHDYAMRCKVYCLSMMQGFRIKTMHDPVSPQRMREPGEDLDELEF